MIGLVDCNNFYVSCERVFQPRLEGVPVGVMSNNDGCVIARSNELKALGVEMGTPAFELAPLVRQGRIRLLSSNYELYGDMSARVREVLEEFSAGVEPYSIDEMFVRFDGFDAATTQALARTLYRNVRQFTGIPVCVGVAHTRTLAKLANRAAKKLPGYHGVCVIPAEGDETRHLLERTALGDVWGVGRRLNLIKFALYDGPRISEAQALAWEDVLDVNKGIIRYRRAVVRGRFKVTKTKRSTRVHHLLKPAREALQEQYALTGKLPARVYEVVDRDNGTVRQEKLRLVFLNSQSGKPFYENAIRQRFWKTHLEKAGDRYRGPNQCRHTFISQLLSMGVVPLHWIAGHVGHATITMIQRRYGKWIRSDGPDIPALIEKHLEL